jgi:hypothetical protein
LDKSQFFYFFDYRWNIRDEGVELISVNQLPPEELAILQQPMSVQQQAEESGRKQQLIDRQSGDDYQQYFVSGEEAASLR